MFNWNQELPWLFLKVWVALYIFIPMELMDMALSHFFVPRAMLQRKSHPARYRRVMKFHDRFLFVSSLVVAMTIPWVVYLATAKPG